MESIDRPGMLDPLEDVLALVGASARLASTLVGHGDWALRFPAPAGAKFNAVLEGTCVVAIDGRTPLTLHTGDVFLLTRPVEFVLSTSSAAAVEPASPYFGTSHAGVGIVGPRAEPVTARLIGGSFEFDRRARHLLLDGLPQLIHLPAHADGAFAVQEMLMRIDRELRQDRLGSRIIAEHLALVMFIDLLRHIGNDAVESGWLRGLGDPVTAAALRAIHGNPARAWTVRQLADVAYVSRSTLAARFKRSVGLGPLEYLTRWRIEIGADRLTRTDQAIATIARAVGYGSEAAFGLAFKRELGTTPGAFRRTVRQLDHLQTLKP